MPTTEAAIQTYGFSQLYLQLGEPLEDTHVIRVWHKPYITLDLARLPSSWPEPGRCR
jgi:cytochrome c-type biogenesis protein CcmF